MRTLIGDGRHDGLDGAALPGHELERERASAVALWAFEPRRGTATGGALASGIWTAEARARLQGNQVLI